MPSRSGDNDGDPDTDRIARVIARIDARKGHDSYRLEAMEQSVTDIEERLSLAEQALHSGNTKFALLQASHEMMQASLDKINTILSRLNWAVIATVVVALLHLVIKATPK